MKAIVIGADGQLGRALCRRAPATVQVLEFGRSDLDITAATDVGDAIGAEEPDLVINAAAYTDVEKAESESARAYSVNAEGAGRVGAACREAGCRLVHLSTDYVFDGEAASPYRPGDAPNPISEYGRSKLEGERLIAGLPGLDAAIVRTAWLYAAGGRNFVMTMLGLMQRKSSIRVVADQTGSPTWAGSLADALWVIGADNGLRGIYHYTDEGMTSWHAFSRAIMEEALALKLLAEPVDITPISTDEYPTAARRPRYSVLDCTGTASIPGLHRPAWRDALRAMLNEVAAA